MRVVVAGVVVARSFGGRSCIVAGVVVAGVVVALSCSGMEL